MLYYTLYYTTLKTRLYILQHIIYYTHYNVRILYLHFFSILTIFHFVFPSYLRFGWNC